jgi:hypothetical protein
MLLLCPGFAREGFYIQRVGHVSDIVRMIDIVRIILWEELELISRMSFRRVFEEESPLCTPAEGDSSLRSE